MRELLLQGGLAPTWASHGGVSRGGCEEQEDAANISLRCRRKNCGQVLATAPPSGRRGPALGEPRSEGRHGPALREPRSEGRRGPALREPRSERRHGPALRETRPRPWGVPV